MCCALSFLRLFLIFGFWIGFTICGSLSFLWDEGESLVFFVGDFLGDIFDIEVSLDGGWMGSSLSQTDGSGGVGSEPSPEVCGVGDIVAGSCGVIEADVVGFVFEVLAVGAR